MSNVVTQLVLRSKVKENVEVAPTSMLPSLAKRKMKLKVRGKKCFFTRSDRNIHICMNNSSTHAPGSQVKLSLYQFKLKNSLYR